MESDSQTEANNTEPLDLSEELECILSTVVIVWVTVSRSMYDLIQLLLIILVAVTEMAVEWGESGDK